MSEPEQQDPPEAEVSTDQKLTYVKTLQFHWQVGTENSVVIGAHWQGKTWLAKYLIASRVKGRFPMWIWDYNGKFADLAPSNVIHSVKDLKYGTQIVVPLDKSPEHFEQFCIAVNKQANLHVIIDEAHTYCSAHQIPPAFAQLVRDKGNQNVSYTCIQQRPAEIHKSIISNAQHRFVLAFDVPTDVVYLRNWIGTEVELFLPPNSILRRFHKGAPKLPPYSFIYRDMKALTPQIIVGGLKIH